MKNEKIGMRGLSKIALEVGDMCIYMTDAWEDLKNYRVRSVGEEIVVGPFVDVLNNLEPLSIKRDERDKLLISPYSRSFRSRHREVSDLAWWLRDLVSSHLRQAKSVAVPALIDSVSKDPRLQDVGRDFIEGCLRCCVASRIFVPKTDKRRKVHIVTLELSAEQHEVEKIRIFAGTLAGELSSLSERVRHLIRHTSTVGTYRENLLQILLRKHLPERYHVATGFIYGCARQIDIVIYDRIDYAPIFREGDLVVVPPESVRAVIEVKTNLTKEQLWSSLKQIEEVAIHDDCRPPFFKGIFAFESDLEAETLLQEVVSFYRYEPTELQEDVELEWHHINAPYHHLTSLCVLGSAYGRTRFEQDSESKRLYPVLHSYTSVTGLNTQASHFLETLLAYLRFGGLKPSTLATISDMLGADTQTTRVGMLTPIFWGPYFALENGMSSDAEKEVEEAEATIFAVEGWIAGQEWQAPSKPGNATD